MYPEQHSLRVRLHDKLKPVWNFTPIWILARELISYCVYMKFRPGLKPVLFIEWLQECRECSSSSVWRQEKQCQCELWTRDHLISNRFENNLRLHDVFKAGWNFKPIWNAELSFTPVWVKNRVFHVNTYRALTRHRVQLRSGWSFKPVWLSHVNGPLAGSRNAFLVPDWLSELVRDTTPLLYVLVLLLT